MCTRRTSLHLLVALLTFIVGLSISFVRVQHRTPPRAVVSLEPPACPMPSDTQQILNIDYCDMMASEADLDGRIVRFEAIMLAGPNYEPIWDHVRLGASRCEAELIVHEHFHLTSRTCPAVLKTLDELLMRDDPAYPRKNAKVRVVGKFHRAKWTGLERDQGRWESERFTIISIERAASIDEDN